MVVSICEPPIAQERVCVWPTECLPLDSRALLQDVYFRKVAAASALNGKNQKSRIAGHFGRYFTTQKLKVFFGPSPMIARLRSFTGWLTYRRNWRSFSLLNGPKAA